MITGFNSEVRYNDITFHIQTEDRGKKAARIDTIIYKSGGAIVHKKRIYYDDILNSDCLEQAVKELMREIHQRTIKEVQKGLWLLDPDKIPSVSLEDVILKYLLGVDPFNFERSHH
jgi:hypothetical protein